MGAAFRWLLLFVAVMLIFPANTIARKHCGDKMTGIHQQAEMARGIGLRHHVRTAMLGQALSPPAGSLASELTDDADHQSLL
jgi:hypothetical protein